MKLNLITLTVTVIFTTFGTVSVLAQIDPLYLLQRKQKLAISRVRFSVVSIKSFNQNNPGIVSIGSGVIVSRHGHVVTNSHVVSGYDTIEVGYKENNFLDRGALEISKASLLTDDKKEDLALLEIREARRFLPAPLDARGIINIGERIFIIGNPYNRGHTVTRGIISKRRRTVSIGNTLYKDMIQTDASINHGNSGGPMINMQGNIIGLTSAIFSTTESSMGLGFAIPVDRVRKFVNNNAAGAFGAMHPVAATKAAKEKEIINLTAKVPHPFLGDCLKCHTLAYKTPITLRETVPHPDMGACTKCHQIVAKRSGEIVKVGQLVAKNKGKDNKLSKEQQRRNYKLEDKYLIIYMAILLAFMGLLIVLYKKYIRKRMF